MTIEKLIDQWKQRCAERGMDPAIYPGFGVKLNEDELRARQAKSNEFVEVTTFFIDKFLAALTGSPMLIGIIDQEGYLLELGGDPTILGTVSMLGIVPGVRTAPEDGDLGPSAPALCLMTKRQVELRGKDHYHDVLHDLACCAVPVLADEGTRLIGAITIMTSLSFMHPYLSALLATVGDSIGRELQLRRQNTQLQILNQVLVDTSYYGLIITDADGIVIDMNTPITSLAELGLIEAGIGASVFEIGLVAGYFERVLLRGEEVVGVELQLHAADQVLHFILDVVPIYDGKCSLIRVVGSLRNITDMKTTEEVLHNTEKLVFAGRLAVSIAHEVRNPLTTVKGLLQYGAKDERPQHYDLIMSELERMNLIVSEFMILGKPQAVLFKEEDCSVILDEVLRIFGIQAGMNGIAITAETAGCVPIHCDRNQIKQVFFNILRNSMEAMPYGGSIQIRLRVQDGRQYIRFTDDGIGMTEDVQRRLGEPFLTTKHDGNGLGMMIVRRIIAAHQGDIAVHSQVGKGTSVELCLS